MQYLAEHVQHMQRGTCDAPNHAYYDVHEDACDAVSASGVYPEHLLHNTRNHTKQQTAYLQLDSEYIWVRTGSTVADSLIKKMRFNCAQNDALQERPADAQCVACEHFIAQSKLMER